MRYSVNAIETNYKGVLFRSRLEARWAAFFDVVGWEWGYEPVDFSGWIPDFAIYGHDTVYVEVKPVVDFPSDVASKIGESGCEEECLIVGQCPFLTHGQTAALGWLRDDDGYWAEAVFGRWGDGGGRVGFCHSEGSFADRISGGYEGGSYGQAEFGPPAMRAAWANACNNTRWRPVA